MVAVLQPVKDGRIIPVDRAVVLVGRSSDCDAVIVGSQKISRRHCCLVQVDNDYYVRDLGSMNGVWLNGNRVNREAMLNTGDCLSIGDVEFLFHPNARIESKKTVPGVAPPPPKADDDSVDALSDDSDAVEIAIDDSMEAQDDVIPLSEIEAEFRADAEEEAAAEDEEDRTEKLVETNEVEAIDKPILDDIDEPIVSEDSDMDGLEDIIVFED